MISLAEFKFFDPNPCGAKVELRPRGFSVTTCHFAQGREMMANECSIWQPCGMQLFQNPVSLSAKAAADSVLEGSTGKDLAVAQQATHPMPDSQLLDNWHAMAVTAALRLRNCTLQADVHRVS